MKVIEFSELPELTGQEVGVSDWLVIDQKRVDDFANATGDHQWIHVDVERANREIGGPIAHGYLTLSIIPMLTQQILEVKGVTRGINYGCNKVRFTNSLRVGGRVRARSTMLKVSKRADALQLTQSITIEIDGEQKPACVAETVTLVFGA